MKAIIFLASALFMSATVHAEAPSVANGQRLFKESRCLSCHGVNIFTRVDRKVTNLTGLESKVRQCDANLSTNWFDDQIMDVVAYLNATYYKFNQTDRVDQSAAGAMPEKGQLQAAAGANVDNSAGSD